MFVSRARQTEFEAGGKMFHLQIRLCNICVPLCVPNRGASEMAKPGDLKTLAKVIRTSHVPSRLWVQVIPINRLHLQVNITQHC